MKKYNVYNIILVSAFVLLILLVSVVFGYSFAGKSLIVASSRQSDCCYYMVEIAKYDNYDDAQQKSQEVMAKGGAGFVFYDEGFRVFLSSYLTYDEASNVSSKNNCSVYEFKITVGAFGTKFSQNVSQIFKNNYLSFRECIGGLNHLILSFQDNEMSNVSVRENCLMLLEEIDMQIEKFNSIFFEDSVMYHYKNYLTAFRRCFSSIIDLDCDGVDFSRSINYQQISAIITLRNMANILV